MMSGHSANLIFFNKKKIKIGHPEHSLPLPPVPLRPITSHVCLIPPPSPPQSDRHMCINPINLQKKNIKIHFRIWFLFYVSFLVLIFFAFLFQHFHHWKLSENILNHFSPMLYFYTP